MNYLNLPEKQIKRLYQEMLRIRRFEEHVAQEYSKQAMRCPVHLCIGQEAVAVGVSAGLELQDLVYSNHRSHGHYLAKGGDMIALIAEFYGLENGCVGGRGGSMHLMDLKAGFAGSTPIVGGTVPVATGAAWAQKLRVNKQLVVSYFGDGCFEEGAVYESLNFAALHKLPMLYICENNLYSVYTQLNQRQPENRQIYKVAQSMGLQAFQVDGNDVLAVYQIVQEAIRTIRAGEGPVFIEALTYRWPEHCGPMDDDHLGYRPTGELKQWQENCPIDRFAKKTAISESLCAEINAKVTADIEQSWQQALQGLPPCQSTLGTYVYAD